MRAGSPTSMRRTVPTHLVSALCIVLMLVGIAGAQPVESHEPAEAGEAGAPGGRKAAAAAFDRGTAAYLEGDFEIAAGWYEAANRFVPLAEALVQAARAYQQAGDQAMAATLALALRTQYPEHELASEQARALLELYAQDLLLVHVVCDSCSVEVDGHLRERHDFFVAADRLHTLVATLADGTAMRQVRGRAGQEVTIELSTEAPTTGASLAAPGSGVSDHSARARPPVRAPAAATDGSAAKVASPSPRGSYARDDGKPLSPTVVYLSAGAAGGLAILSVLLTVDTLSGVRDYEQAALAYRSCGAACVVERERAVVLLEQGEDKQARTLAAWVATGAVSVGTVLAALLATDWGAERPPTNAPRLQVGLVPTGESLAGSARLSGVF